MRRRVVLLKHEVSVRISLFASGEDKILQKLDVARVVECFFWFEKVDANRSFPLENEGSRVKRRNAYRNCREHHQLFFKVEVACRQLEACCTNVSFFSGCVDALILGRQVRVQVEGRFVGEHSIGDQVLAPSRRPRQRRTRRCSFVSRRLFGIGIRWTFVFFMHFSPRSLAMS